MHDAHLFVLTASEEGANDRCSCPSRAAQTPLAVATSTLSIILSHVWSLGWSRLALAGYAAMLDR